MRFDLLITNVRIIDGCGNPWYRADIGTKDGKIAAIGALGPSAEAVRTIDGRNMVASPGFIDPHSHSDFTHLVDGHAHSKVRQGVTLEVTNQCGGWAAPLAGEALSSAYKNVRQYDPDFVIDWNNHAGYFERLERQGISVNVAALVGHGSVRASVFGYEDRPPTDAELGEMLRLLGESMEAGCFGMSSGIYYAPGSYATMDELVACCKVVAAHGGYHAPHIRDESNYNIGLMASLEEVIEISRRSGVSTQLDHIKCLGPAVWGKHPEVIALVEAARAEGLDITADQYPYTASGSSITGSLVPRWAQVGGRETMVARLKDPAERARMKADIETNYVRRGGPERLVVALFPPNRDLEGKSMAQVAATLKVDPAEAAMLMLADGDASFVSHVISEEDAKEFMRWGLTMVGSDGWALATDGPLSIGSPHPRSFGTFPRVLAYYSRELGVISLPEAIRKMTSYPAQRLGLQDRGLLREGYWADIVLFDPDTVQDNATFEKPLQYPSGIPFVIVNGEVVIDEGEHTGRMPGKVLRR